MCVRVGVRELCSVDSGHTIITDSAGLPHRVYVSVTRDGSAWLRAGLDHSSTLDWITAQQWTGSQLNTGLDHSSTLDWIYVDEPRTRFHAVILDHHDLHILQVE